MNEESINRSIEAINGEDNLLKSYKIAAQLYKYSPFEKGNAVVTHDPYFSTVYITTLFLFWLRKGILEILFLSLHKTQYKESDTNTFCLCRFLCGTMIEQC